MSPKTLDRYRELADYLSPNLKAMPISNVRAMDLHEEWRRLLASGGQPPGAQRGGDSQGGGVHRQMG
jgi:hypothetical protein